MLCLSPCKQHWPWDPSICEYALETNWVKISVQRLKTLHKWEHNISSGKLLKQFIYDALHYNRSVCLRPHLHFFKLHFIIAKAVRNFLANAIKTDLWKWKHTFIINLMIFLVDKIWFSIMHKVWIVYRCDTRGALSCLSRWVGALAFLTLPWGDFSQVAKNPFSLSFRIKAWRA